MCSERSFVELREDAARARSRWVICQAATGSGSTAVAGRPRNSREEYRDSREKKQSWDSRFQKDVTHEKEQIQAVNVTDGIAFAWKRVLLNVMNNMRNHRRGHLCRVRGEVFGRLS